MNNNLAGQPDHISETHNTKDQLPEHYGEMADLPPGYEFKKPSLIRRLLPIFVIGIALVGLGLLISLRQPQTNTDKPPASQLVDTVTAEARSLTYEIASQGSVEPRTETVLVPEVVGKVISLSPNFVAGGFFTAGETLLQVDPSDYQTALASVEANLAGARALLAEEQARAEQAKKDWDNLNEVIGSGTRTPNPLLLREPQLAQQEANVRSAEAEVERARRNLQRTKISLPYSGLIKERTVDLGQFVSTGTSLGTAFSVDFAEIRLPLTESDRRYLKLPSAFRQSGNNSTVKKPQVRLVTGTANNQQQWVGEIIRTEGTIDTTTRVSYAIAVVADPYGLSSGQVSNPLRMGTFVQAYIEGNQVGNVIALPRASLREDGSILIASADNKLEIRQVEVDRATPETVFINTGIESGERIITTAIAAPIPGAPLRIVGDPETTTPLKNLDELVESKPLESTQEAEITDTDKSVASANNTGNGS